MSSINFFRNKIWKLFTRADNAVLSNKVSSLKSLEEKFYDIKESGLYLHIPFCRQICSYCPYNKELYCNRIKICIINSIWNHPSHIISNLSLPKPWYFQHSANKFIYPDMINPDACGKSYMVEAAGIEPASEDIDT